MKYNIYLFILSIFVSFLSCNSDNDFILTENEALFIEDVKITFEAEDVKIRRTLNLESQTENSIEINILNSSIIEYNDPEINTYVDEIFIEFIKLMDKEEKQYTYVKILFSKGDISGFKTNWESNGKEFNTNAIQNVINQLNSPEYIYEEIIQRYIYEDNYDSLLLYTKKLSLKLPDNPDYLKYHALAFYHNNEKDSSIHYLKKGRLLIPEDYEITMNLAIIYGENKNYELAFIYIDTTLQIYNEYPKAIYYRGFFHYETGNKIKACEDIIKAEQYGFEEASSFILINCN